MVLGTSHGAAFVGCAEAIRKPIELPSTAQSKSTKKVARKSKGCGCTCVQVAEFKNRARTSQETPTARPRQTRENGKLMTCMNVYTHTRLRTRRCLSHHVVCVLLGFVYVRSRWTYCKRVVPTDAQKACAPAAGTSTPWLLPYAVWRWHHTDHKQIGPHKIVAIVPERFELRRNL